MASFRIQGIGVSEGIRIGRAYLYKPHAAEETDAGDQAHARDSIAPGEEERELNRLRSAKASSEAQLHGLVEQAKRSVGEKQAGILKGQLGFLQDPKFYPEMERLVREERYSAERAVSRVVEHFAARFAGMANEYMRERAADFRDLGRRLTSHLRESGETAPAAIDHEVILVADDLAPSDTVQLDKRFVLGFVTRTGGKTSHTAILSRSLGIAAVVGAGDDIDRIRDGDLLVIDGGAGLCLVNPEEAVVREYRSRMDEEREQRQALAAFIAKPAVSSDGFRVEMAANIGTAKEAKAAVDNGAEAIGLYRTEFLFMNADRMPDEAEQFAAYKEVAEMMGDRPVVIRTLDIGGDKELPYLALPKEMNPFLGYRAIRIGLDRKDLLATQLRAILRASAYGKLKVMFPMIASLSEWREAMSVAEEVRRQLRREQLPFDESMEFGIMVEIPSAALMADRFAREVDFFSIGTNDLVQYTLAVDRMNEKVAYLYDYFHPAVLRLIRSVIEAAHGEGKWVGMCGGMAGDPLAAPFLLGLRLDEWSMDSGSIGKVKRVISRLDSGTCRAIAERLPQLESAGQVREELQQFLAAAELDA